MEHRNHSGRMKFTIRILLIALCTFFLSACGVKDKESAQAYREKADLLKEQALAEWVRTELGISCGSSRKCRVHFCL